MPEVPEVPEAPEVQAHPTRWQRDQAPIAYRVDWVPGTDVLVGSCRCGATRDFDDPIELWAWLTAHPHDPGRQTPPSEAAPPAAQAHRPASQVPVPS
jgi:hypothetical protein